MRGRLDGEGEASSAHWHVWHSDERQLWATTVWGQPTTDELERLVATWDLSRQPRMNRPFRSLVDCREIGQVDPPVFAVVAEYMRAHRADYERLMTREALVRPDGLSGSIVTGFFAALDYQLPYRVFTSAGAALGWLVEDDGAVARELGSRLQSLREVPELVRRVGALLEEKPAQELTAVARALGRSPRTLQRQLDDAKSSFVALRTVARVRRAEELLAGGDDEIAAVAAQVGCASAQHFSRMFRAHRKMTPLEWRRRNRP